MAQLNLSPFLKNLSDPGSSAHCSVINQRVVGVEGSLKREEVKVYLQLIHVVGQQKPTQNCEAIMLRIKKIK